MEFLKNVKSHGMLLLLIAAWFGVLLFVSDQDDQAVPEVKEIYTFLQAHTKGRQFWTMSNTSNTSNATNGTVTGDQNIAANLTITGDLTYSAGNFTFADAGTMTVESGVTVTFAADAVVHISAATTFAGAGTVVFLSGSTGTWTQRVSFTAASTAINGIFTVADIVFSSATTTVTSSNFTTAANSTMQLRSAAIAFVGTTITGLGSVTANAAGVVATMASGTTVTIPVVLATPSLLPVAKSHRGMLTTPTGSTVSTCDSTLASATIAAGSATLADLSCTLASNTNHSADITSLTYSSGSYSQYNFVSGTGRSLHADSVTGLDLATIEVTNTGSGAFTQEILHYDSPSTCITQFAASNWNTCASGYTCSITGGASDGHCGVFFNQVMTPAASPSPTPDDSNDGLYALFALFAIPVALLIGLAIMKMCKAKPVPTVVTEVVEQYPVYPAYPTTYAAAAPAYPAVATSAYDVSMPVPPSSLY